MYNRHNYRRCRTEIVPDSYFKSFYSECAHTSQASWVTCQFSPDISNEHLLLLGDQDGQFFVVDVRYAAGNSKEKLIKKSIRADNSCILELEFVPKKPFLVVSLSGHSNVRLWNFERSTHVYAFKGHEGSVRALAVSPFNGDVFVTGSRDGMICEWDQRATPNSLGSRSSTSTIVDAHSTLNFQRVHGRQKQRGLPRASLTQIGITSLTYLDENTIISSSTSFKTDIRLWDMRYRSKNRPVRTLEIPQTRNARDFGVASLCLDRFHASLFVACTDSSIYEYAVNSSRKLPVAALSGVPRLEFNAFDVRLASSPISDHLLFGSGDDHGLIWDFQQRRQSVVDHEIPVNYYPYPKYILGGHQTEVRVVRISSSGQYIVSMDDAQWRLWKARLAAVDPCALSAGSEQAEYFQLPETALDSYKMTQLSVDSSVQKMRKRKMASPFVSPSKPVFPSEKFSPATKMFKQLSSPLSSITNILNEHVCGIARRKLEFDNEELKAKMSAKLNTTKNFFNMKYPTMHLPDFVKERELLRAKGAVVSSSVKGNRRNLQGTMEDYIALGKPVSNCSKMVKALERKINLSPRKLVLKRRLQESAKIAAARYTPKTPHREKRGDKTGVICTTDETNINDVGKSSLKNKKRSGSVRTLEDYFNKPV